MSRLGHVTKAGTRNDRANADDEARLVPRDETDGPLDRDAWRTPPWLVSGLAQVAFGADFDFDFDVAASSTNFKAPRWFGIVENGLSVWPRLTGRVWCNPPWSAMTTWLDLAVRCAESTDAVVLGPCSDTTVRWSLSAGVPWALLGPQRVAYLHHASGRPMHGAGQSTMAWFVGAFPHLPRGGFNLVCEAHRVLHEPWSGLARPRVLEAEVREASAVAVDDLPLFRAGGA